MWIVFEPILFFLLQKEKNGFNLPRKERGPVRTVVLNLTQKISAISRPLRSSLPPERSLRSAHHLSAELHSKTDVCGRTESSAPTNRIRKMMPDRHHQDSVRRGVRRSQLHSTSAGAAKAPYSLAPSSFPNCDRCAGSQFGDTGPLSVSEVLFLFFTGRGGSFLSQKEKEKNGGAKASGGQCPPLRCLLR